MVEVDHENNTVHIDIARVKEQAKAGDTIAIAMQRTVCQLEAQNLMPYSSKDAMLYELAGMQPDNDIGEEWEIFV